MSSFASFRTLLNIVAVSIAFASTTTVVDAQCVSKSKYCKGGFTGSIVVNGPPCTVFAAIQNSRNSECRKVVSKSGNCVVLEEKFFSLPIIGDAKCKYKEVEMPPRRIDYKIVQSKQFKQFEGNWELCPVDGGKATLVKLTSKVEAYLKVPFSQKLTDHGTKKDIKRRLADIKCRVEVNEKRRISFAP